MIDFDNMQVVAGVMVLIALICPIIYSFFVDNHKKGTPDPRTNQH